MLDVNPIKLRTTLDGLLMEGRYGQPSRQLVFAPVRALQQMNGTCARQRGEHFDRQSSGMRIAAALVLSCVSLRAHADATAGEQKAQLCLACHKEGAELRFTPFLEGQPADYLVAAMTAFKTGQRQQPAMNTNAASLSPADIHDLADYFSAKPLQPSKEALDPAKIAAGEKLVADWKCATCHTQPFHGAGLIPRLAGQKQRYLTWQLQAFRSGGRAHPPLEVPMSNNQSDAESVASYLASLR